MNEDSTELLDAIRPLDREVERALVDNYRRFLTFVQSRVGNRQSAEEILQSAYVRTLDADKKPHDGEGAVPWFYRILRNAIIDHARRRAVESAGMARLEGADDLKEDEFNGELCRCFEALLPTLKPEYARLLRRVDLDGVSVKDAAVEEGLTANNAAVRLHRARLALRKQLERSCGSCATHGCLDCTCRSQNVHLNT